MHNGDSVTIIRYPFEDLKIGDIIAYQKFNTHITIHRIKSIITDEGLVYLRTQGDNNDFIDRYNVTANDFWGKAELMMMSASE